MKPRLPFLRAFGALLALTTAEIVICNQAIAQESGPSFEQILANPDDPQLNLDYARAETKAGHLLTAAAALERVLSAHPGAHSVRLFYAALLYRLDDLQGAQAQLKILEGAPLPPLQTKEREKFNRLTASARKTTKISGQVSAGIDYESDAQGALLTEFDFLGTPVRKPGAANVFTARVDVTSALNPSLDIYGSASGYSRSSISGPKDNLLSGEIRLGLAGSELHDGWKGGIVARRYLLFSAPYLTEYGAQGEYAWHPDTSLTLRANLEMVQQDYHEPLIAALSTLGLINGTHDGFRANAGLGLDYRLTAGSTIGGMLGFETKNASYQPFSYDEPYGKAYYHAALGDGISLDLTGGMRFPEYHATDAFFLGVKRRSVQGDAGVSLGVPLSAMTADGATADELENIALVAGITYSSRDERFPLADFESAGGSLKLVWRFGDGT
jgi:hypothetical protein